MAIRHRKVFPEGSSPDSIDWREWNDDHDGAVAGLPQDQIDALDGANAPDGSNPFATMADVGAPGGGGGSSIIGPIVVTYAEFVDAGGSGIIDPFYTVPLGSFLTAAGISVVEIFDDSTLGAIDINEKLSGTSLADADSQILGGAGITIGNLRGLGGGAAGATLSHASRPFMAYPSAAELIMKMPDWAGDGTQGIAHVYLEIKTPVAP